MLRTSLAVTVFAATIAAASTAYPQLSFAPPVSYGAGGVPQSIPTADLNRDGLPDVMVATGAVLQILMNNADGTLAPSIPAPSSGAGATMVTALRQGS